MKVLNWVTRRFLNVPSCVAVLPDMENDHVTSKYDIEEKQALLEHGAHLVMDIDVFEDWKDGILSIGTLAISPLGTHTLAFTEEVNYTNELHDYNLNYTNDNLEENPLMNVELFSHELDYEIVPNKEIIEEEASEDVIQFDANEDFAKDEWQTNNKRRVTLADLLLADSDHKLVRELGDNKMDNQVDGVGDDMMVSNEKPCVKMIKPNSRTKQGLSKAKKLLKEDLRPIKKINQLMKRMMKKKIHPDLEGKIQTNMEMQPIVDDVATNSTMDETHDSPSHSRYI